MARRQRQCAALAGKSTLSRLALYPTSGSIRYHKIRPDSEATERLWVDIFVEAYREALAELVLDLDATDVPLHGHQEARVGHQGPWMGRLGPNAVGLSRGHIMNSADASLKRLGTDYIDLYQIYGYDALSP